MKTKDIFKQAVKSSAFTQDQIDFILNRCEKRIPGYSKHFTALYDKALQTRDEECVNLCSEGEIHYLISQSHRVVSVIEYIQKALGLLKSGKKIRVLDIGATQFTILFKDYFGFDITALDRTGFLKNRFHREGIELIECDFMKGEDIQAPDNSFDLCIFTEVFEHLIVPPKKAFVPIRRVLKNGGMLIFSTPNIAKIQNRWNLLLGKRILDPIEWVLRDDFDDESPHGLGHIREYSMEEVSRIAEKYQFSVVERSFPNDLMLYLGNDLRNRVYRLLQRLVPSTGIHCQILARLEKTGA